MAQAKSKGGPPLHRAIAGLQRLVELFAERRAQLAAEAALSEAQWRVLEEIARPEFLPSLFARRRECTPAAVSKILRQLSLAGLVTAGISADDGRQRRYRLTARGERALEQLHASREQAIDRIWREFEPRELAAFASFAERLATAMETYAREAAGPGRKREARAARRSRA
jgi:DNA-binding MarR family transcriptional regulator